MTKDFSIKFLGGAGTVTGSKYQLNWHGRSLLIDCGLFQGHRELRERNWQDVPVDVKALNAILLTHAHLDHSGYIPVVVASGYKGPVYTTPATRDLCKVLLADSGYLMERDAEYANKYGFSRHVPAKPLYTKWQAERALERFETVPQNDRLDLGHGLRAHFRRAGHILGSSTIEIADSDTSIVFSGDLGRPANPTMPDPAPIKHADYIVIESTYGDRRHEPADPLEELANVINRTAARGGTVLIPAFAVGRTQIMLYYMSLLKRENRIPALPVFLDSPMAINASEIFCEHLSEHSLSADECAYASQGAIYTRTKEQSMKIAQSNLPKVIISASGMATGGRVLHHMKRLAVDHRNTILFTGFQAAGTRGARILAGERKIKIHGEIVKINCEIADLSTLSAHADCDEILAWLGNFSAPPRQVFVTHGEISASAALAERIREDLGWACVVPEHGSQYELKG